MRYVWVVAVLAGLFLCWMAYHGARQTPDTPDRLVVTYGLRDAQGRQQVLTENVAAGEQVARWMNGFHYADECDIGKRNCPMDIRLDFYQGTKHTCSLAATSDGCCTVHLLEGTCPSAGKSGFFAVRPEILKPFVQRQQALARMGPERTAAVQR